MEYMSREMLEERLAHSEIAEKYGVVLVGSQGCASEQVARLSDNGSWENTIYQQYQVRDHIGFFTKELGVIQFGYFWDEEEWCMGIQAWTFDEEDDLLYDKEVIKEVKKLLRAKNEDLIAARKALIEQIHELDKKITG